MGERITRLTIADHVKNKILTDWENNDVANWVISNLQLLELGEEYPQVSVFKINYDTGVTPYANSLADKTILKNPKLLISGGLEGTKGHLRSIKQIREIGALINQQSAAIFVLLEPDSYIRKQKSREPLITLEQRVHLWSTSGEVDAVVVLPEILEQEEKEIRYRKVHELLYPALWCTSVENPHHLQIIRRGMDYALDVIRLLNHNLEIHTSFLASTRNMSIEEVEAALRDYVVNLVNHSSTNLVDRSALIEQVYIRIKPEKTE